MRTKILLSLIFCFSMGFPDKIVVDVKRTDQLNVSEIAEKVFPIPLRIKDFKSSGIQKVYLIDENIFILQLYTESQIRYSHVYIFDILGNYKGEIVVKDPDSKEPLHIFDMLYDDANKHILLSYSDGYRIFDNNGNLLSHSKREKFTKCEFLFKGFLWSVDNSQRHGIADYSLVNTNLNGQNKDTINSLKTEFPSLMAEKDVGVYASPCFSVHNNELFVSFGIENAIYKVNQHSLTQVYSFEFKNRTASSWDIFGATAQVIINRFVKYGYRMKGKSYDFLYDTKTKISYNFRYHWNNDGVTPGIKDDICNTGFFNINITNNEDYIFFFKPPEDLKGSNFNDPQKISPIVFLVKLK
jgi:hypothetical protein